MPTGETYVVLCFIRAVHYERDMSHYIWLETALDIPSSEAKSAADHTLAGGTLIMKARGYTPAVQRYIIVAIIALCGLQGCKNRPAPFPDRMS